VDGEDGEESEVWALNLRLLSVQGTVGCPTPASEQGLGTEMLVIDTSPPWTGAPLLERAQAREEG
jgi:hypothetical protein